MPADDLQFDVLKQRFQMEGLSISPVTSVVLSLAERIDLVWPFDRAIKQLKDHLAADDVERIRLMLEACMNVIRQHDEEIRRLRETLSDHATQEREQVARELLLDAARKAQGTRAKERVKRIGLILGNAVVEAKQTDSDEIEEMMRVAIELSDRDIVFLRELIRIEGRFLEKQNHIPRTNAYDAWKHGFWKTQIDPEIDSVFSKLESYGLVSRIPPPNNLNITADFQNRYVLLKKGLRFETLMREAAVGDS